MRGKFELDLLRDDSGNAVVVTGATVSVTVEGTGVPADLYDDLTGPAGPGNPFTVTGSTIEFFADQDSRYRLDITTLSGYSRTLRYRDVTIDVTDIKTYADTQVATHSADVDNVHGIASGDAVESVSGAQAKADTVQTNLTTHIADSAPHPNLTIDFDKVTYPSAYQINSPTHIDTLLEFSAHVFSAGVVHGCAVTDNGDGTISIDSGYAVLRGTIDPHLPLYAIGVNSQGPISLTDSSENYVYLDYNAGSPQWVASTSRDDFNCIDKCIGYYIYREGTDLNIIKATEQNVDSNRKSRQLFLKFQKFIHAENGTQLGGSGLALTVTAGEFFFMLESIPHLAFDTSVSGIDNQNVFTLWYRDGIGGWTQTADSKVINSTVYDNNTGTPVAISNNKYGVSWVYIVHDEPSSLHVVMGQADYSTVAEAEVATPPSSLPGVLGAHGSLIGFVIYLKSAPSFIEVLSAFTQIFTSSAATNHNVLAGLQGGTTNEYYHFTNTQYTAYGYHTRTRTTAAPNATVPVHSLTAAGAETNIDWAGISKGNGATLAQIPDSTATGGNKRGAYATDFQKARANAIEVASGIYSTIGGGEGNTSSGSYSTISGGTGGSAIGTYAVVGGGNGNTSSGGSSTVSGGSGGICGGDFATIGGGNNNTANADWSSIGGGASNVSSGEYSTIPGGLYATTRLIHGAYAYASGRFSVVGDAQTEKFVLRLSTTDSTPSILTSDGSATPITTNVCVLPDNHAYAITARAIGRDTTTGDVYHVVVEGTVKRVSGAATTALDGTPVYTTISQSAGSAGWDVSLVANTSRGSAEIQVTGETGTTIHWVCKFDTVEVG